MTGIARLSDSLGAAEHEAPAAATEAWTARGTHARAALATLASTTSDALKK